MKKLNRIKALFKKERNLDENKFYNNFFIKNKSWNSYEPNEDETIRLTQIVEQIEKLQFDKNCKIIDIGCGRGWLANKLKKYGSITAIDPIEGVIEFAKKQYKDIDFSAGSPNDYLKNNPNRKFDLVVSSEVLEHVINKKEFLDDIHNLLETNGHLVLTTPRKENFDKFTEIYSTNKYQPVEEWVDEQEIRSLFKESNFEVVDYNFFSPLPNFKEDYYIYQIWTCKKK